MAFNPIRLVSPDGVCVRVGSAVEREQLLARGYTPEPERTPAPAPAREADRKPVAAKPDPKTSK
ncbi:hypothetical protein [Nocardia thailandica]|uniref:hypothetical protein n=1 Tax=Nocardia thailandica TaxID=257275 RepID=UPI000300F810|nr:hypothetical protein [Nocardia thailandica]